MTESPAVTETPEPSETPKPTEAPEPSKKLEVSYPAFSAEVKAEDNDGMGVTVSAPEGAFPEGTELSVKPVKDSGAKKALDSVLNFLGLGSLVGESPLDKISGAVDELMDSATGKDTSAAFDITFLYNGEEVQPAVDPATGAAYEVQVTFTPLRTAPLQVPTRCRFTTSRTARRD